jgi:hypothetical protein
MTPSGCADNAAAPNRISWARAAFEYALLGSVFDVIDFNLLSDRHPIRDICDRRLDLQLGRTVINIEEGPRIKALGMPTLAVGHLRQVASKGTPHCTLP